MKRVSLKRRQRPWCARAVHRSSGVAIHSVTVETRLQLRLACLRSGLTWLMFTEHNKRVQHGCPCGLLPAIAYHVTASIINNSWSHVAAQSLVVCGRRILGRTWPHNHWSHVATQSLVTRGCTFCGHTWPHYSWSHVAAQSLVTCGRTSRHHTCVTMTSSAHSSSSSVSERSLSITSLSLPVVSWPHWPSMFDIRPATSDPLLLLLYRPLNSPCCLSSTPRK